MGNTAGLDAARSGNHACVVTTAGGVKCWGDNRFGQLGDGTTITRPYPVDVPSLASGVAAVATGASHSCALTTGGGVKCWGEGFLGQLGNGGLGPSRTPVDVTGLQAGIVALAAGADFTCALTSGGGVRCWGANGSYQIGAGSPLLGKQLEPLGVTGLASGAIAIAAGGSHACALMGSGAIQCWGDNRLGELGLGVTFLYGGPSDVPGFGAGTLAVAAGGGTTCAVTAGGGVKCWGLNDFGQVGDGTSTNPRLSPADVSGLASGVTDAAVGSRQACARLGAGGLKCWGRNANGELGDGTTTDSAVPVDVIALGAAAQSVAIGGAHACARLDGGSVKCWGANDFYQGGNGQQADQPSPVAVLAGDSAPDAFAFAAQPGVPLSSLRTSNTVTPAGLSAPALVTVANGETAISCTAPFTTAPTLLEPGQSLCVRHVSSANRATAVTTTLTVGGVAGAFTSTTSAQATLTTLAGPAGPSTLGQAVTFIATVSPGSPAGTVTFLDGGASIAGCASVTLASGQATCLTTLPAGSRTISASYAGDSGNDPSVSAPFVQLVNEPGRLVNLSTRAAVDGGDNALIAGFILAGIGPKTVVVRARGPSLAAHGVSNTLADTRLDLFSGQSVLVSNDDWQSAANAAQVAASGFAPTSPQESAILTTLMPGAYTAIVSGTNGATGTAIVEVFEVDAPLTYLYNIATRAQVLTGQGVVIGGFAVHGNQPQSFVIRARGPSLAQQGVSGVLQDPALQVYTLAGTLVASNDNWGTSASAAQLQAMGFAPSAASEAAIRITLEPGLYTAIVSGVGGTTGVAIVEVFAQ